MRRSFQRFGFLLILAAWVAVSTGYCRQVMNPADLQILQRASVAYEEERYIEVIGLMEGFLETPVENPDPWLLLAGSHLALKDAASAVETIDRGLDLMPDNPRLLSGKADIHLEREEYEEALHIFEALYRRSLKDGAKGVDSEQWAGRIAALNTHLGGLAVQQNNLDKAEAYFGDALIHQADSLHSYTNLAFIKLENDDPEGALDVVNRGLERFSNHSGLQKMKASILSSLEDAEGLEEVLAGLLILEPENLELAGNYLTLLLYNEQFEKADQFVEKVLEENTLGPERYRVLAGAYEKNGFAAGQIRILQQYLREYPDDTETELEVASLLVSINETGQAKEFYRRLYESGNLRAGRELARLYALQDSLHIAENIYENLTSKYFGDVDLLWEYAAFLNERKRPEEAIVPLDQILTINRDPRYLYERALAGDRSGEKEKAMEMYENLSEQGFYHPAMFLRLLEEGRLIPGLGEGCSATQSLFNLILTQSIRKQQALLAGLQDENGELFREEKLPEPAGADLGELNKISGFVLNEITGQCGAAEAEIFIEDLLRRQGSSGKMAMMAARFFEEQQRPKRALELAEDAVALSPDLPEAHFYHARLLETQKEAKEAGAAYERVLSLDDRHEEAYAALVRIYRNTNRLDELCDRWLLRYRTNRNNEVLYRHLHDALLRAGRWEDAGNLQK